MTEGQKFKFYFPAWRDCCQANHWHMAKGKLEVDESRLNDEGHQVVTFARQLAAKKVRAPKMDDLRHAAHIVALGRDKSSKDFTNAEVDRVVTLFRLMQDPDNIKARLNWQAFQSGADPGQAQRLNWVIKNAAPFAYIDAICRDKFPNYRTPHWEDLSAWQKQQLIVTLKARAKKWRKSEVGGQRSVEQQLDPENAPF